MTRPLVFVAVAYVAGIALGPYLPLRSVICLAAAMTAWAALNLWRGRKAIMAPVPFLFLFLAAGLLAFNLSVLSVSGDVQEYHNRRCTLVGMVADEPLLRADSLVFPLILQKARLGNREEAVGGTVRVTLYHNGENVAAPSYGRQVSVRGMLVVPQGKRNPGGFDYQAYLNTRGLAAAFYGENRDLVLGEYGQGLSPVRLQALKLKEKMQAALRTYLPSRVSGLLVAILFGERQVIEPSVENALRRAGVAHLMAVSGLHVGLLAALLFFVCKRLAWRGWPACLIMILFLLAYTYLTGLKPATLRAFVMIALGLIALCLGRRRDLPTAVAAAALFTLIYNPLYLFHIGLQLSYTATIAILLFAAPLQQLLARGLARLAVPMISPVVQQYTAGLIAVTTAAQLGIMPLGAYYFKEISLVALPANMLILPVIALLLGSGLFIAILGLVVPPIASLLSLAAYPLLAYILWVSGTLAALPFAARQVFPPRPLEILLYYAVLILIAWKGREFGRLFTIYFHRIRARVRPFHVFAAILLVALPVAWWGLPGREQRPLEVVFLDVGQGDAIYIRTPGGRHILLDGGGRPAYLGDMEQIGYQVVIPYLQYRRVRKLDLVIVSHPHEDHYGGLLAVLDKIPVGLLVTNGEEVAGGSYQRLLELAGEKAIARRILQRGEKMQLEPSLELAVLNPPPRLFTGTGSDLNNNSLVLHLLYREVSFLFTGDIEDAAAASLLAGGLLSRTCVLKVPHHGGYMAAYPPFLEALGPQLAIITVGRNSFGHPHENTLSLLRERGIVTYRTDYHGAVMLRSDGFGLQAKTMLIPELLPFN